MQKKKNIFLPKVTLQKFLNDLFWLFLIVNKYFNKYKIFLIVGKRQIWNMCKQK